MAEMAIAAIVKRSNGGDERAGSRTGKAGSGIGIALGTALPEPGTLGGGDRNGIESSSAGSSLEVYIDAKELVPHRDKPWFEAYLSERHRIPISSISSIRTKGLLPESVAASAAERTPQRVQVSADTFRRHGLLSGSTGGGKTRLALHLLTELMRQGCSVVAIDPKEETLGHLAHCARMAGLAEDQISVLLPGQRGVGCPGWNPLDYKANGVAAYESVAEFVKLVEASSPSWGARMADVLKNAARLAAYHDLSLVEMVSLLRDDAYREGLLRTDPPSEAISDYGDRIAYSETRDYFLGEFASWSASRRAEAIDPVLNKVRALLDIPFMRSLLCARESTLDLASLWSEDRRKQRVVLVHLDFRALGGDGALLLAGLMSYHLFQTAMRVGTHSARSVVLYLDELGIQERFVGSAIRDILAMARSFNLRLLVACQHLGQLSPELRQALLTVAFRAFFRLGPEDAKAATAFLAAAKTGDSISRVALDLPKRGKYDPPETAEMTHLVMDTRGNQIDVPPLVWAEFDRFQAASLEASNSVKVGLVRMLLSRVPRVYVRSAADKEPYEVGGYVAGLVGRDFVFTGPSPLRLVVSFPKPRVTVLDRISDSDRQQAWCAALMALGEREAAVVTPETGTRLVRVLRVDLPEHPMRWHPYLASEQSAEEIEATWRWRRERMAAVKDAGNDESDKSDNDDGDAGDRESGSTPPARKIVNRSKTWTSSAPLPSALPSAPKTAQPQDPQRRTQQRAAKAPQPTAARPVRCNLEVKGQVPLPPPVSEEEPAQSPEEVRSIPEEPEAADDGSL